MRKSFELKDWERSVDIKGVGLYTLGKHRKKLTDSQKKQYEELFKDYFLKSFSGRLVGYTDAKIAVLSEEVKNEKYTIVYSKLIGTADRPEVAIDWRVYTKDPENPFRTWFWGVKFEIHKRGI